jgi:hypothetical protein
MYCQNRRKTIKGCTVRTEEKSNRKIIERDKIDTSKNE